MRERKKDSRVYRERGKERIKNRKGEWEKERDRAGKEGWGWWGGGLPCGKSAWSGSMAEQARQCLRENEQRNATTHRLL